MEIAMVFLWLIGMSIVFSVGYGIGHSGIFPVEVPIIVFILLGAILISFGVLGYIDIIENLNHYCIIVIVCSVLLSIGSFIGDREYQSEPSCF